MHAIQSFAIVLALALISGSAMAQVDLAKSTVSATARQIGVPIEGTFRKISASVNFNPAQLAQSSARVEIDVASYDMGSPEYNKEVIGKEWFNAAQFPKATFVSGAISAAGAGKYSVAGKLTLKGKTTDVVIPFTLKADGATQVFDGVLPIKRTVFNVGEGEWKDTSVVADEVVIKFHLVSAAAR